MTEANFDASLSRQNTTGVSLALAISPAGRVHLDILPSDSEQLAPSTTTRIRKAFERSAGSGLLHLGASELASTLTPSLVFGRELAHLFMVRLCALPDLAQQWQTVHIAPPLAELEQLAARMPPMTGAEYLDLVRLEALWVELHTTLREEIAAAGEDVQRWLAQKHPSWNMVGRVCFHLAENKASEDTPFAFLATYVANVSQQARAQHLPLGRALQEYAGAANREALLALLLPVQRASEQSPWLKSLVESGAIFHPIAWTPGDAHRFLQNIPIFEASGIVVRIPDWWKPHQPPRPQVKVNIGNRASGLGMDALMDFSISVSLGDEQLTEAEWKQLLTAGDGLVRLKGRWVEVDRAKLDAVLAHWKKVQRGAAGGEITFLQGMRLLAGTALESGDKDVLSASVAEWSGVTAGDWLQEVLDGLRHPQGEESAIPEMKAQLRPYQQDGVRWLWWLNQLGLGGCLADDMGLGKTVQVLALLLMAKQAADPGPHLLVVPASLIANWQTEIARFAPSLRLLVAHPSAIPAKELASLPAERLADIDVVITSYGSLLRLPWIAQTQWSLTVLDEAQAIKNPGTKQTRAVKALKSRVRLALTGTPVENRLGDLWSLFDFICPGLLGSDKAFSRLAKRMAEDEQTGYAPLRKLVQPYILRRLKSDKRIIADLPDKTEVKAYCSLSRSQARLYQESIDTFASQLATLDGIQRRGAVLAFLMRLKQICNHPSQWLGDGRYAGDDSGKFARLREIIEEIAARQEKFLVFTQFQEMTAPLAEFLHSIYGQPGLVLHGATPVKARKTLVDSFQREDGPPFFVLSIKAGGTGLNLTAASHVIHFDRWWNPAVENQATDRAYRIGQKKNVLVHKFICRGTVEEKIDALIEAKLGLSNEILEGGTEMLLSEMGNDELLQLVSLDLKRAMDEK
ncbi:DEAD/DEAH box helicase [Noviherbaspirillum saxi]|uniref:DEAD/DEAH box helicase n=1 Tax=Noviherbaspirillum saxi TaxID=2320863 RepID=A0A3A3G9V5_9BURK|nr:DEAD/DEAH box helicase [Noviherbaspirillum saxi]RJF97649.1 DEAD/DEAH box helicase [Noviherbaspirillum saxi]